MAAPPLLLRLIGRIVPSMRRDDWIREWHGEIHHSRNLEGQKPRTRLSSYLRMAGALEDAVWLRWHHRGRGMLIQDVRYGIRGLGRQIGFTSVVILTLALGIGANTAIFTLVDAVLLRPLPVDQPSELVDIYTTCRRGFPYCSSSYPDFLDYRDNNRAFSDLAAFTGIELVANSQDEASLVGGMLVTGAYFKMLGVNAALGRMIIPADDRPGSPRAVAVLSNRVWQRDYGSDAAVIGRDIRLNGAVYTIIGVAPPEFRGTRLNSIPDLWIPFSTLPLVATGSFAEFDVLSERAARWIGGVINMDSDVVPQDLSTLENRFAEFLMPQRMGSTLLSTLGALTLLLAVVGITGIVGYAVNQRRREIGIRIALGASNGHIVRVMIRGALVPIGAGLALGVLASLATTRLVANFMYDVAPTDTLTFVAMPLLMAAVAVVAAYLPARRAIHISPTESLRGE